ncbi:hypothetical protein GLOIN_2v1588425 [Rhizophagus irregularis DAOM 181602=DAOM 197198]|uniref:BTB domain-containing protein n=1 Tax=Rhizophagus irregularis (strain DAOM 181602 / DAOM 197198 / MUCL 43194) TaxID=747089 RepID=A0A2P4Q6K8_RHIID|nr:hypothetical protein GLOIN_2v1588425 [Rhizophagus irregularis DAOM 181602=DAOM 197198]POG73283.1 hypothetical protein GLOIN_2v1588425 [Rhizophagus irregularis DAOM 181602=DAOM 197198]|eukprot:XP_025180149.1 hypothetical protein GLOIN_2v1588425 [Rhizophagus irregularis DAOM 181602=DAOM 197198]
MVILYYRSPYLRRILSTNKKKNDGTLAHIKLPNILPETFQIILRYIYSGEISLKEYDTSDIIKILVAASELSLQELVLSLQLFLIENESNWMELNFNLIYQTGFENSSFLELQKYCTDLISKEPDKIFKSPNFSSIPEKLLVSLIQSDNLRIDEIHIWEYVLKWGLAQNPVLPSELTSFSKEDFNALKNSLHQCVPFIRFYNLTSEEFSDKVLPYKKILPKELYKDLLKYFLSPNNQSIKESKRRLQKESLKMNIVEDSLDNINYGGEESKFDIKSHRATEFEKKESTRKEKVENSAPHININAFSQTQSQASQISTAFAQPTFGQSGFGFGQPIFGQSGFGSSSFSNITLKIPSGGGFARFARSSSGFGSASITSKSVYDIIYIFFIYFFVFNSVY